MTHALDEGARDERGGETVLTVIRNRTSGRLARGLQNTVPLVTAVILCAAGPLLAADYETGLKAFRAGNTAQALEEWQPLADAGEPDAQHSLGMMYEYGRGVAQDDVEAARWYEKAAEQNNSEAQYRLGVFYDNGWGVARNDTLAAKWYERAAHRGHAFAQHDLAYMYLKGSGVPQDKVQAYKWLKIASAQRADLMGKHLLNVSKTMTADEIRLADKLAADWLSSREI